MPNNYKYVDVSQPGYPLKDGYFYADYDAGAEFEKAMNRLVPGLLDFKLISKRQGTSRSEALFECSFNKKSLSNHSFYIYVCPLEGGGRSLEHEQRIQFRPGSQWSPDLSTIKAARNFVDYSNKSLVGRECYCIGIYKPFSHTESEDIVFAGIYPQAISPFEGINTSNGSIQVDIRFIQDAYKKGVSIQAKDGKKRVICFKPQYLFWYMINRDELHLGDLNIANAVVEEVVKTRSYAPLNSSMGEMPLQQIYYGAPGTGKSHTIEQYFKLKRIPDRKIFRVTFHPDTDYSSFVGCYKPTTLNSSVSDVKDERVIREELNSIISSGKDVRTRIVSFVVENRVSLLPFYREDGWFDTFINSIEGCDSYSESIKIVLEAASLGAIKDPQEGKIVYSFVAQPFLKAYVESWRFPDENVYLVIEEINRGNCAQIFGDIFQLLDRGDDGYSKYKVRVDSDIEAFLKREDQLGNHSDGIKDGSIKLPPNLFIWATMNTSDQSLYQMDSAFKRRWEQVFVPIQYDDANDAILDLGDGVEYPWGDVLGVINKYIKENTVSSNKTIGNRFIDFKEKGQKISYKTFRDKVLFYLFTDVFKDNESFAKDFFGDHYDVDHQFFEDLYADSKAEVTKAFFKRWEKEGVLKPTSGLTNDDVAKTNNEEA